MNKEQVDKLLKLFEQGLTSTEEEDVLLEHFSDSRTGDKVLFNYIMHQKKMVPDNLENQIWSSIQSGEKKKKRFMLRMTLAAASVILVISYLLIFVPGHQEEMTYREKVAILEEAQSMISGATENTTKREIIYEDDVLIIYTD